MPIPNDVIQHDDDRSPFSEDQFPCSNCGARLVFKVGTDALTCPYCGTLNEIAAGDAAVEELDFHATLRELAEGENTETLEYVECATCTARVSRPPHADAMDCPFCGRSIVMTMHSTRLIKPKSLLPFAITRERARASFKHWVSSLWFAPSKLKQYARTDTKLHGIYVPHWTYDCGAVTDYTGQRGEDYWETEYYTTRVNGKTVRKSRQVRKTRWYSASGTVHNAFNDLLVRASHSLPAKYADALEPWDIQRLVPYQDDYLAGFSAENYQVDLEQGFSVAQSMMNGPIRSTICRDIGGDRQRIHSTNTRYHDITFKHILLPVWVSTYRFGDKAYRFLVNARTGEVQGERPWSFWKIAFAVLAGLLAAGIIALVIGASQG